MPVYIDKEIMYENLRKRLENRFGNDCVISFEYSKKNSTKESIITYIHPERILPVRVTYHSLMRKTWTGKPPDLT